MGGGSRGNKQDSSDKVFKIYGRKANAVARSIENDVLSVEPWEVRKKCADVTPKTLRSASMLAPVRRLALKEAPAIPGCAV